MKKSMGQLAYEGYCQTTGWKSAVSGQPLPQWGEQKEIIQQAWESAARAVVRAAAVVADTYEPRCESCPRGVANAILHLVVEP